MARGSKSKRNRLARLRAKEDIEAGQSNSSSQNKERLLSSQSHKVVGEIRRLSTNYNTTNRSWTIGRVPSDLREINKDSFAPKIISIGPFYFGNPQYSRMDDYKRFCLNRLLELICVAKRDELQISGGSGGDDDDEEEREEEQQEKVYQKLVVAMKSLEIETRKCYSERFDLMGSDDFVQMMILDGCFVVEFMRLFLLSKFVRVNDDIFTTPWLLPTIRSDLLKLENQLPFFVLERLFEVTKVTILTPDLMYLILSFFDPLLRQLNFDEDNLIFLQTNQNHENQDHLLSIFYSIFLIPQLINNSTSNLNASPADQRQPLYHSAMDLQQSGIKLKKKMDHHLLDIDFNKGVLEIPTLTINEDTVSLYLNFMAYEQCDHKSKPFFISYFLFFDGLINTQNDVEILVRNGIIKHEFGSNKEVANFFNKFYRGTAYNFDVCPWYYSKQIKEVNGHCKGYYANKCHQWWRNFCDKYFSNPWSFLSLLGALALLSLTTTQTFYAVCYKLALAEAKFGSNLVAQIFNYG